MNRIQVSSFLAALVVPLIGCASEADDIDSSEDRLEESGSASETSETARSTLSTAEVKDVLRRAGVTGSTVDRMACVAHYATRNDPEFALGGEECGYQRMLGGERQYECKPGTISQRGLFRIDRVHDDEPGCEPESMYDPVANAKCAYRIYKTQGLRAWRIWTKGRC